MKESNDLEILPLSSAVYVSFANFRVISYKTIVSVTVDVSCRVSEILDAEVTTLTEYDLQKMSFKVISHQKWHKSKARR